RLACTMMTLAPHAAKLVGRETLQVYVADGPKYRMQVFALEDLQDGNMTVYCPDVLDEAVKAGLLSRPVRAAEPHAYTVTATHDHRRPPPERVEPGTFSTPEPPRKPPSDAIDLFDGAAATLAN